jgi:excinuclease UvrABC ATPase subunit
MKHEFPKIPEECTRCDGSGLIDISHHGSPMYEDCRRCKGKEHVKYFREMDTDEKLDYLLQMIK